MFSRFVKLSTVFQKFSFISCSFSFLSCSFSFLSFLPPSFSFPHLSLFLLHIIYFLPFFFPSLFPSFFLFSLPSTQSIILYFCSHLVSFWDEDGVMEAHTLYSLYTGKPWTVCGLIQVWDRVKIHSALTELNFFFFLYFSHLYLIYSMGREFSSKMIFNSNVVLFNC